MFKKTTRLSRQTNLTTVSDPPIAWAASYMGKRDENEDDYGRADQETNGYDWRNKGFLYVVADGVGGLESGDEASRIAVEETIAQYSRYTRSKDTASNLAQAVMHSNQQVYCIAEQQGKRMGSTITACLLKDGKVFIAHAGDSRAYRLRGDKLSLLTKDHIYGFQEAKLENINAVKQGERGHLITRALGKSQTIEVELKEETCLPEDRFLLCSDGLSDVVDDPEIEHCLRLPTPEEAVRELWNLASGRVEDNATAIVIFASGNKIRRRRYFRKVAYVAALMFIIAASSLAGVFAWRLYGSNFSMKKQTEVSTKPQPAPTEVKVVNSTRYPILYWQTEKESDSSIRLKPKGKIEDPKLNAASVLYWRYERDGKGRFIYKIGLSDNAEIGIEDPGEKIWKKVEAAYKANKHSPLPPKTNVKGKQPSKTESSTVEGKDTKPGTQPNKVEEKQGEKSDNGNKIGAGKAVHEFNPSNSLKTLVITESPKEPTKKGEENTQPKPQPDPKKE